MLVAAVNYGNNLIFLLAFAVLALIVNSAWQGWRALASVQVAPLPPAMRPAGTVGHWTLQLVSRPGVASLSLGIAESEPTVHASLAPGETTEMTLALLPAPRGYLPLPEVILRSDFPLGLWEVTRRLTPESGQWVYPSPIEGPSQDNRPEPSHDTGSRHDPGGDPTHLRAYQPGDPMRRVVFRHYAKTGRLVSRETEGEPRPVEPTIIDYERYRGAREQRLSAMTQRLITLAERDQPWTLRLPGMRSITAAMGDERDRARREALRSLARFGRSREAGGFDHVPAGTEDWA